VRTWTLVIPAPCEWITANPGSAGVYTIAGLKRQWRRSACIIATTAKLPRGLDYVRIDTECWFPTEGRLPVRDRDNLRPTLKAAVDGLGPQTHLTRKGVVSVSPGYGLIVDDSDRHIAPNGRLEIHRGAGVRPMGELRLTIVEVERAAS